MEWFWKLFIYPLILITAYAILGGIYLENTVFRPNITEVVSDALKIDVSSAVVQKDEQAYGRGYRVFAELSFDGTEADRIEQSIESEDWQAFPLTSGLEMILQRDLKAESPLEEGYYYFENLSDDADGPLDDSFAETIYTHGNFELAVYDTEADTLYYYCYLEP